MSLDKYFEKLNEIRQEVPKELQDEWFKILKLYEGEDMEPIEMWIYKLIEYYRNNQKGVYNDVLKERVRQNKKWGVQNHVPMYWLAILAEEVLELTKEVLNMHTKKDFTNYRKELIQVAAVCVAALECLDRNYDLKEDKK